MRLRPIVGAAVVTALIGPAALTGWFAAPASAAGAVLTLDPPKKIGVDTPPTPFGVTVDNTAGSGPVAGHLTLILRSDQGPVGENAASVTEAGHPLLILPSHARPDGGLSVEVPDDLTVPAGGLRKLTLGVIVTSAFPGAKPSGPGFGPGSSCTPVSGLVRFHAELHGTDPAEDAAADGHSLVGLPTISFPGLARTYVRGVTHSIFKLRIHNDTASGFTEAVYLQVPKPPREVPGLLIERPVSGTKNGWSPVPPEPSTNRIDFPLTPDDGGGGPAPGANQDFALRISFGRDNPTGTVPLRGYTIQGFQGGPGADGACVNLQVVAPSRSHPTAPVPQARPTPGLPETGSGPALAVSLLAASLTLTGAGALLASRRLTNPH